MALLLCSKRAEKPFYYEKLDLRLWSLQELCYVLYHYPVLVPEDFVDQKLLQWLREELEMPQLAERLSQLQHTGADLETLMLRIQRDGNYYTERELSRYSAELKRLRDLDSARLAERLGDTLFRLKRYGRAVAAYRESVTAKKNAAVLLKLGDAYVTVMQFRKAAAAYEEVYTETHTREPLRKLYYLFRLEPSVDTFSKYKDEVPEEEQTEWTQDFDSARQESADSPGAEKIRKMYEEGGKHFRTAAQEQIRVWKRAYRAML